MLNIAVFFSKRDRPIATNTNSKCFKELDSTTEGLKELFYQKDLK